MSNLGKICTVVKYMLSASLMYMDVNLLSRLEHHLTVTDYPLK
jgi:hypothetical protein